jgi:hypothetical protein
MTAKEHYESHLGYFYSWMAGDFNEKQSEQRHFFTSYKIIPRSVKIAFDLGPTWAFNLHRWLEIRFNVKSIKIQLHRAARSKHRGTQSIFSL